MRTFANVARLALLSSAIAGPAVAFSSVSASAAVVISSAATQNMRCSNGYCTPTAADAVLNAGDLTAMLASGNVEVSTGPDTVRTPTEDIDISAGFSWGGASSLTLSANRSINFLAGNVAVNGSGAVTLNTYRRLGITGSLNFYPGARLSFASAANSLTINRTAFTLENSITALAGAIAANPAGNFALANNYDASQDGTYHSSPIDTELTGHVDGLGNTISNLSINIVGPTIAVRYGVTSVGLFSETGGGVVSNMSLTKLNYRFTLRNASVGGLVGTNNGIVANDYASGSLLGNSWELGGGLVGYNFGTISGSHSAVGIGITGRASVGGLAGMNRGTIELSSATGSVQGRFAGGLVGDNEMTILKCFANGRVSGDSSAPQVVLGGLIGESDELEGNVENSYAIGTVNGIGQGAEIGGLYGSPNIYTHTYYSYSSGRVSGKSSGSFAGGFTSQPTAATSSYWNMTTSKLDKAGWEGNVPGVTGLTSKQLRSGLPAGFDPTIWAEKKGVNRGFPYLINNPPPKD